MHNVMFIVLHYCHKVLECQVQKGSGFITNVTMNEQTQSLVNPFNVAMTLYMCIHCIVHIASYREVLELHF